MSPPPNFSGNDKSLRRHLNRAALKILGSDHEPFDLEITPDVTAQDILTRIGLEHSVLVRKNERNYFHPEEAIYDQIHDGDMLYAFTVCTIGNCAG